MRILISLSLLAFICVQATVANGRQELKDDAARFAWVDELFGEMDSHGIAGGVCAIVQDDQVVHLQGYGVENRESRQPIDPRRTRFYLASVTKSLTATLIFRLVDRGMVDLDEDISVYLGGDPFIRLLPKGKPITLRHLLTHTAGFDDRNIGMAVERPDQLESLTSYLARALPPQVRPSGEITMYDNHGWALAGLVAERVTGQNYADLLRAEVFAPLGMLDSNTDIRNADGVAIEFAAAYVTRILDDEVVWKKATPSYRLTAPAGSVWATAADATRFMRAHLGMGEIDGAVYLSSAAAAEMQANSWIPRNGADGLTPGFWERHINGRRVVMIVGSAPEGASIVAMVPDERLGVFLAVSRKDASYLTPILQQILSRLAPGETPKLATKELPGWGSRSPQLAGEYYLLRFSERSLETLAKWQAWIQVRVIGPGKIQTVDSAGNKRVYHEVAEFVFRQAGKPGYLAFKEHSAGELKWATTTDGLGFGDGMGFANSFQKARWFERIAVKRRVLIVSMLALSLVILIWPLLKAAVWLVEVLRRRRRSSANGFAWGACLSWLAASCGMGGVLAVAMLMDNQDQLVLGLPSWSLVPCWLLALFALLTPFCVWSTAMAWRRRAWTLMDRLFATVVASTALVLTPFLWTWNLISWSF